MVVRALRRLSILIDVEDVASARLAAVDGAANKAANSLDETGTSATAATAGLKGLAIASAAGFMALRQLSNVGMDIDRTFATVAETMNATEAQMSAMREQAVTLGQEMPVTMGEVTNAFKEMAFAGMEVEQAIQASNAVTDLAIAAQMDMGRAAKTVTQQMKAFNIEADAAGTITDSLAGVFATSALELETLATSMEYVSATASTLGFSMTETAAAVGLLADNGLEGSKAGTALNQGLNKMTGNAESVQQAMEAAGLSMEDFTDEEGNMLSMTEIAQTMKDRLDELNASGAGLQRWLVDMFGQRGAKAWAKLIENADEFGEKVRNAARAELKGAVQDIDELNDAELAEKRLLLNAEDVEKMQERLKEMDEQEKIELAAEIGADIDDDPLTIVKQLREQFQEGDIGQEAIATRLEAAFDFEPKVAEALASDITNLNKDLDELEGQFDEATTSGELAEAQMDEVGGKFEYLRGTIQSVAYTMYQGFEPVLSRVLDGLIKLTELLQGNEAALKAFGFLLFSATAYTTMLTAKLGAQIATQWLLNSALWANAKAMGAMAMAAWPLVAVAVALAAVWYAYQQDLWIVRDAVNAVAGSLRRFAEGAKAWTEQWILPAFDAIGNAIGWVVDSVAALINWYRELNVVGKALIAVGLALVSPWLAVGAALYTVGSAIVDVLSYFGVFEHSAKAMGGTLEWLGDLLGWFGSRTAEEGAAIAGFFGDIAGAVGELMGTLRSLAGFFGDLYAGATLFAQGLLVAFVSPTAGAEMLNDAIETLTGTVGRLGNVIGGVVGFVTNLWNAFHNLTGGLKVLVMLALAAAGPLGVVAAAILGIAEAATWLSGKLGGVTGVMEHLGTVAQWVTVGALAPLVGAFGTTEAAGASLGNMFGRLGAAAHDHLPSLGDLAESVTETIRASFARLGGAVGSLLAPVANALGWVTGQLAALKDTVTGAVPTLGSHTAGAADTATAALDRLTTAGGALTAFLGGTLASAIAQGRDGLAAFGDAVDASVATVKGSLRGLATTADGTLTTLRGVASGAADAAHAGLARVATRGRALADVLDGSVAAGLEWVRDGLGSLDDAAATAATGGLSRLRDLATGAGGRLAGTLAPALDTAKRRLAGVGDVVDTTALPALGRLDDMAATVAATSKDRLGTALDSLWGRLEAGAALVRGRVATAVDTVTDGLQTLRETAAGLLDPLDGVNGAAMAVALAFSPVLALVVGLHKAGKKLEASRVLASVFDRVGSAIEDVRDPLDWLDEKFETIHDWIETIAGMTISLSGIITEFDAVKWVVDKVSGAIETAQGWIDKLANLSPDFSGLTSAFDSVKSTLDDIVGFLEDAWGFIQKIIGSEDELGEANAAAKENASGDDGGDDGESRPPGWKERARAKGVDVGDDDEQSDETESQESETPGPRPMSLAMQDPQETFGPIAGLGMDPQARGEGLASRFADGIAAGESDVERAVGDTMGLAAEYMPASDAERGPLSTLFDRGRAFSTTFADGIIAEITTVQQAAERISAIISNATAPAPDQLDMRMGAVGAGGPRGHGQGQMPATVGGVDRSKTVNRGGDGGLYQDNRHVNLTQAPEINIDGGTGGIDRGSISREIEQAMDVTQDQTIARMIDLFRMSGNSTPAGETSGGSAAPSGGEGSSGDGSDDGTSDSPPSEDGPSEGEGEGGEDSSGDGSGDGSTSGSDENLGYESGSPDDDYNVNDVSGSSEPEYTEL